MPHINLKLYPGRSETMKIKLAQALRKTLAETSGCWVLSDISVSVEELKPEEFEKKTKESFVLEQLLLPSDYIRK